MNQKLVILPTLNQLYFLFQFPTNMLKITSTYYLPNQFFKELCARHNGVNGGHKTNSLKEEFLSCLPVLALKVFRMAEK